MNEVKDPKTAILAEFKDKIDELNQGPCYCYDLGSGDLALDHVLWRNDVFYLKDLSVNVLKDEIDQMIVETEQ